MRDIGIGHKTKSRSSSALSALISLWQLEDKNMGREWGKKEMRSGKIEYQHVTCVTLDSESNKY